MIEKYIVYQQPDGRISIEGRLLTVAETIGAVPPLAISKEWQEIKVMIQNDISERYLKESEEW